MAVTLKAGALSVIILDELNSVMENHIFVMCAS
jgi:hypothetical protein